MSLKNPFHFIAVLVLLGMTHELWGQSGGKFTADYHDVPLESVLEDFRSHCGFSISYDPDSVALKSVSNFKCRDMDCDVAFTKVLDELGFKAYDLGSGKYALSFEIELGAAGVSPYYFLGGQIIDQETGFPLPGATVAVPKQKVGAYTDSKGKFDLVAVRNDIDSLEVRYIGYRSIRLSLKDIESPMRISLKAIPLELASVEVRSRSDLALQAAGQKGALGINPRKVDAISVLGERDVFRTLQYLPGISSTEESSNGLFIRGGTPDQNLVLIEGIPIYNTGHFFGMFHAFNADALDKIHVSRGGFSVEHGGATAGLVDIYAKPRIGDSLQGGFTANLAATSAFVSLPFKNKRSALMLAGRRSYSDIVQSPLYKQISGNVFQTGTIFEDSESLGEEEENDGNYELNPLSNFHDFHAKWITDFGKAGTLSANFYNGRDVVRYDFFSEDSVETEGRASTERLALNNNAAGLNYGVQLSPKLFSTSTTYFTAFQNRFENDQSYLDDADTLIYSSFQNNRVRTFSVKSALDWQIKTGHSLKSGVQFSRSGSLFELESTDNEFEDEDSLSLGANLMAVFFSYRFSNDRIDLAPGLRVSFYGPDEEIYLEPRLRMAYKLGKGFRINANAGHYTQFLNPIQINNSLKLGMEFLTLASQDNGIQTTQSTQFGLGVSWLQPGIWVDVQAYHKTLYGLERYVRSFDLNTNANDFQELLSDGDGSVWGMDFLVRLHKGPFSGWIGYTLSQVLNVFPEINGDEEFAADHDHLHEFKTVLSYELDQWEFSASWVFASGKPYSKPAGIDSLVGDAGEVFYELNFSQLNNLRLPAYHRLDANVAWKFGMGSRVKGRVGISLFNIYNRDNIRDRNYSIEYPENDTDPLEVVRIDRNLLGFSPNLFLRMSF